MRRKHRERSWCDCWASEQLFRTFEKINAPSVGRDGTHGPSKRAWMAHYPWTVRALQSTCSITCESLNSVSIITSKLSTIFTRFLWLVLHRKTCYDEFGDELAGGEGKNTRKSLRFLVILQEVLIRAIATHGPVKTPNEEEKSLKGFD